MAYMDSLRATERTAQNQTEERRAFYGLMPASISHEGYSDRPAYSYWDDFWALAGYDGAVEIARALGRDDDLGQLIAQRDEFRSDLLASLRASIDPARHRLHPGERRSRRFRPTATTIALSIAGQQADLPQPALEQTFERYWRNFRTRRDGGTNWDDYTPYELRTVGCFRDGWAGARAPSNCSISSWPIAVLRAGISGPRWSVATRASRAFSATCLTAGLHRTSSNPRWTCSPTSAQRIRRWYWPRACRNWMAGSGRFGIENLRTPYGKLSYTLRRDGRRLY